MTELLLLVIAVAVIYIACKMPKDLARKQRKDQEASRKKRLVAQQLPLLKGKACELVVDNLATFDSGLAAKVVVEDVDGEWVRVAVQKRKGAVTKIVRISSIEDVKELA